MALPKSFKKSPKQDEDMPKNKSSLQDAMMMLGRRKPIMQKEITAKSESRPSSKGDSKSLDMEDEEKSTDMPNFKSEGKPSIDKNEDRLGGKMMFANGGRIPLEKQADIDNGDKLGDNMMNKRSHVMEPRAGSSRPSADSSKTDRDTDMLDQHMSDSNDDLVQSIMERRRFAAGGSVDLDENAMEQPNSYYHQNEEAALKENYDSDMDDMSQPADSNEHGDDREDSTSDAYDMISNIRKRIKAKRGM